MTLFYQDPGPRSNRHQDEVENSEQYIASMLLRFAVLDDNLDIETFLIEQHKADPRIKDDDMESALICALDNGDIKAIELFSQHNYELQPISGDYVTIGSIHNAITSEHQYETQSLIGALSHLYQGISEVY